MGDRRRIALINAVPAAIEPARAALERSMPDVDVWSILDDRLLQDADQSGGLTEQLRARMLRLIDHAMLEGADGVLLTCSMYGPVATDAPTQGNLPVIGADEAAFEAVAELAGRRIAVVASQRAPLEDTMLRLREYLAEVGSAVELVPIVPDGAFAASRGANASALVTAIQSALPTSPHLDALFLAQYSLAPAAPALASTGLTVITGPDRAAARLRVAILGNGLGA
ncbi:aspartate/glutamate racemase family protein [Curtobacterium sp. MCSS17_011]|uniref:aspartate/glutamate racemase family protein n=1 Tax=Curtobacterium sp. MCSS17_011 TaxID=2175643 RepID=UPI0011B4F3C1|nr:aspartate/glutamate racemase family protein [Curtobacterium sp. MCSS17_011]